MYDKYSQATQFSVNGTKLPKHKGLLLINSDKTNNAYARMQVLNVSGTTGNIDFYVSAAASSIIPIECYAGVTMQAGVTGWLLN
jgi:hypothetical protein